MKWLRFFLLLGVVVAVGCPAPSGTAGDANDPALTTDLEPIDESAEGAATATEETSTEETATEETSTEETATEE